MVNIKMGENIAAVLYGTKDVRIVEWPMPIINDDEVLIKIECVGICGSDLKMYDTGRCGTEEVREPIVMGHEGAGVIVQIGSKVKNLQVGDRVAIEPTQPCRACEFCKRGKYNVCVLPRYCSGSAHGNISRYYKHVADFCHKLPDNVTLEEGAAVQPLAIAIHACNRAGIKLGTELVVLGAGPIGLLCAMAARAMGASKILLTDVLQSRLDIAKEFGFTHTLLTKKEDSDQKIADMIIEALGCMPTVTIEACGYPSAQRIALMITRTSGVVTIVGIGGDTVELPLTNAMLREVDIRGSLRIANTYGPAISAVSSGAVNLKSFISHRLPLRKILDGIQLFKSGEALKVIIQVQK